MKPTAPNPHHQPETEFRGEHQEFSGPALAPDDLSLEPRVRTGRQAGLKKPSGADANGTPAQE
jgi:hypothetical protein